jgi:hypothetical protein
MGSRTPPVPPMSWRPRGVSHAASQSCDRAAAVTCYRVGHPQRGKQDNVSRFNLYRLATQTTEVPGGAAMLAEQDLQQIYELAHFLHPDSGVALAITLEACERLALLRRLQDRCTGHYRLKLPEAYLPQYSVYLASDVRERAQERPRPGQDSRDRPAPNDWLVRYIKFLVWQTMDRTACHVAVALGCFLYGYQPGDIATLAPELFNHNIRRVRRRLVHQLQARFAGANLFRGDHHTRRTRPPTAHERQLVHDAFAMFTPWGSPHLPAPAPTNSLLESHFDGASPRSDWERIHALIDPTCAGLAWLIREYNANFPAQSTRRLGGPDHMLAVPCFPI